MSETSKENSPEKLSNAEIQEEIKKLLENAENPIEAAGAAMITIGESPMGNQPKTTSPSEEPSSEKNVSNTKDKINDVMNQSEDKAEEITRSDLKDKDFQEKWRRRN